MDEPNNIMHQLIESDIDPAFHAKVARLYQLTVYSRWLLVGLMWTTVGALSVWGWRYELSLLSSYFTWAALRYGIIFNPSPAIGLTICIAMTASVIVWQSRNILLGIPRQEQKRLEQQVHRICQQGISHPLWKWIVKQR